MSMLIGSLLGALRRHVALLVLLPYLVGSGDGSPLNGACATFMCGLGCTGYCVIPEDGGLFPTFVLTFDSLSTKTLPARVDDDGDSKDVLVKDRVKFKPSAGEAPGLAKRLRMKSKKEGGQACVLADAALTGDVSARVHVAIDGTEGLVDGESLAYLERRPAGGGPVDRLEAVWNAGIDGFTVRAVVNDEAAGKPFDLPGAHELQLIYNDGDGLFSMETASVDPPELDSMGATLVTDAQDEGDESASYALGAQGLGPKGAFWFAQFRLEFFACDNGEVESQVTGALALALQYLDDAEFWVTGPQANEAANAVYSDLNGAASFNGTAWLTLIAANEDGTLLPSTDGPKCEALAKAAQGLIIPAAIKLNASIVGGSPSALPVKSHVLSAKKKALAAIALVNGFKSTSSAKLLKTVHFSIE